MQHKYIGHWKSESSFAQAQKCDGIKSPVDNLIYSGNIDNIVIVINNNLKLFFYLLNELFLFFFHLY